MVDRWITFICVRKLHEGEQELLDTLVKQRKGTPTSPAAGVNYARINTNLRTKEGKKAPGETSVSDLGTRLDATTNIAVSGSRRMKGNELM